MPAPDRLLPVRPTPLTGEALTAYVTRLADANRISRARITVQDTNIVMPRDGLYRIAALAGLDPGQVRQLTLDRYPPSVRGTGATRRHGWRLPPGVVWTCPGCTRTTGHMELLWQTALMPVCRGCGTYLSADPHEASPTPAPAEVLDLVARLAGLAEESIADHRARRRLARYRRVCAVLAASIDQEWPPRPDYLPPVEEQAARQWGAYPCPDPRTVATILGAAIGMTWGRGGHLRVKASVLRRALPALPSSARCLQGRAPVEPVPFSADDRRRLDWFLTRLRHHTAADGLRPQHVPAALPRPGDEKHPPGPGAWLSRARAATALHLLISQAGGRDPVPATALSALGLSGIPSSRLIDGIHEGLGLREADAVILSGGLELLLADGLIDYQRRRDTLRPMTHLPASVRRETRLPDGCEHPGERLALGWVWTTFTHGPMRTSRWPDLPDRDVHTFDTRLDPETRLLLHETGARLLADADRLPAPDTGTPASARRRTNG